MSEKTEYIDREKTIEIVNLQMAKVVLGANVGKMASDVYNLAKSHAIDYIRCVPSADVQEVKHGEWIVRNRKKVIHCSICNNVVPILMCYGEPLKIHYNFCPSCGAKMDGVNNEC